ncbi:hypothetical protein [Caudoviricetes sp.]|nr:hypothetical protein [Caudoviricetes sp.]
MDISLHRVTKIEMSELREVQRGSSSYFVRDITISTTDQGDITITVFSNDDDEEALKVRA